ncbi:hypothetical protein MHYP_G00251620 [Metynnis hypsauchen]
MKTRKSRIKPDHFSQSSTFTNVTKLSSLEDMKQTSRSSAWRGNLPLTRLNTRLVLTVELSSELPVQPANEDRTQFHREDNVEMKNELQNVPIPLGNASTATRNMPIPARNAPVPLENNCSKEKYWDSPRLCADCTKKPNDSIGKCNDDAKILSDFSEKHADSVRNGTSFSRKCADCSSKWINCSPKHTDCSRIL